MCESLYTLIFSPITMPSFSQLNWKMEALYMLLPLDRDFVDSVGAKRVCAPFSGPPNYTYIPETCSKDRMSIDDFSNVSCISVNMINGLKCRKFP